MQNHPRNLYPGAIGFAGVSVLPPATVFAKFNAYPRIASDSFALVEESENIAPLAFLASSAFVSLSSNVTFAAGTHTCFLLSSEAFLTEYA